MARGTISNVIDRIQLELESSIRHETAWAAVSASTSDTVITLQDELAPSIRIGSILSIGTELMRVRAKDTGAKEVTVMRGWRGSTPVTIDVDDEILINPRFTRRQLYDGIIDEISSWGDQLYRVVSYEMSLAETAQTFELPLSLADAVGIVEIRRLNADETISRWREVEFRLIRGDVGVWTSATTSGLLVRLIPPTTGELGATTLHSLVAVPYDVTTTEPDEDEDLVADYGLSPSLLEVVELGVKMRVLADAESGRSSRHAQDEPRRAEEVPPGAALTVAQTLQQNYRRRFGDEIRKLQRKYKVTSW